MSIYNFFRKIYKIVFLPLFLMVILGLIIDLKFQPTNSNNKIHKKNINIVNNSDNKKSILYHKLVIDKIKVDQYKPDRGEIVGTQNNKMNILSGQYFISSVFIERNFGKKIIDEHRLGVLIINQNYITRLNARFNVKHDQEVIIDIQYAKIIGNFFSYKISGLDFEFNGSFDRPVTGEYFISFSNGPYAGIKLRYISEEKLKAEQDLEQLDNSEQDAFYEEDFGNEENLQLNDVHPAGENEENSSQIELLEDESNSFLNDKLAFRYQRNLNILNEDNYDWSEKQSNRNSGFNF